MPSEKMGTEPNCIETHFSRKDFSVSVHTRLGGHLFITWFSGRGGGGMAPLHPSHLPLAYTIVTPTCVLTEK